MKHHIYGGLNFPFVTSFRIPVVRWIVYATIALVIGLPLAAVATIIWWLV